MIITGHRGHIKAYKHIYVMGCYQRRPEAAKHDDYTMITGHRGHKDVSSRVNIYD